MSLTVSPRHRDAIAAPAIRTIAPMPHVRINRVTRSHAAALMQLCDRHMAELPAGASAQRAAGGRVLELMEALFEAPLRAWAWIAECDGMPQGYAFGTVGFSMMERAYYFNLESLFVPADARPSGAASALFDAARAMADELGCIDLRWQVPLAQEGALVLPGHVAAASMIQYVFPTSMRSLRDE
ncbi:GNAT family N-acetyltransferase [Pseudoxanthomonas sp. Root630]|uniref:GNAT family N-acetyltransferase n=1 Tax=Pseudoxanthomonas sp. Root630 TaxID=1736574 RepID=UPI00070339D2|nr:GNAT family N-acetyltransferase [Pseudoxanthomonas sp. Root630]KRA42362.1 hypothetical protein ASD72_13770 [Pseudoxanthomonas sp. Root630]